MFIAAFISLIISSVILSGGFINNGRLLDARELQASAEVENGKVLGTSEEYYFDSSQEAETGFKPVFTENVFEASKNIGETIIKKVKEEVKEQLLPPLQIKGKLPVSAEKETEPDRIEFDLLANSGTVIDIQNEDILFNKNIDKAQPIASITKLATALIFLEHNPGWETIYKIQKKDRVEGGKIYLFTGEKVKVKDLFYLSLVGSANTATMALVHSTGMNAEEFVAEMNKKVEELGLKSTHFYDPIGLNNNNISTAREIAKLAQIIFSSEDVSSATLTKKYEFNTMGGRKKIVYSTDVLLDRFPQNGVKILGGKTGYTELAGYCFVGKFVNSEGREIISVILGSNSNSFRFSQTAELVEKAYTRNVERVTDNK